MPKTTMDDIEIKTYTWDVIDSNAYLITTNKHGLLIDAVDSMELYRDISVLEDIRIIITHSHFDHICGLNSIREIAKKAVVVSTKKCSENMGNQYRNMSSTANAYLTFYLGGEKRCVDIDPFKCSASDEIFEDEMQFKWNGISIDLKACYGHSNDGLIALIDGKWLFSGDTILPMPTVTRFIGGSTRRFWEEDVPYLASLSENVKVVFPGHGESGCLSEMLLINGCN